MASPLRTQAAIWQSSCARVCRSLLAVSVTLSARSMWHRCVVVPSFLSLQSGGKKWRQHMVDSAHRSRPNQAHVRHVARPAVFLNVLLQRTSNPSGKPPASLRPSLVIPRHSCLNRSLSSWRMSSSGSASRCAAVRRGSSPDVAGTGTGAFLETALGRAGFASGVLGAEGTWGREEDRTASSSDELRVRWTAAERWLGLGVGREGLAVLRGVNGAIFLGVGSLQHPEHSSAAPHNNQE